MSGERAEQESGWTVATLKQHYDSLREADKDALAAALQAVKEDNEKTALAFEKRFDNVNEFRGQLSDQANTFLPRPEYDANHKALEDKIQALTDRVNISDGQNQGSRLTKGSLITYLAAAVGAITLIVLLANNKIL